MAYGKALVGEVLLAGTTYHFELAKADYVGAVDTTMEFGDPAIMLDFDQTDNPFEPHKKHRLRVTVKATANLNLDTFEFINKTTWRGSLYIGYGTVNEQLLYRGYLTPFELEETVKRYELNPMLELTLTDGINFLKAKNYGIPAPPTVKVSLKDLIAKALKQTGHGLPFEIYDNGYEEFMAAGATDCPLAQTFVDTFTYTDDSDKPWNYYDVLIDILNSRNLSLKQENGVWQIVAVHEARGVSINGRAYNLEGVYTGAKTLDTSSGSVGLNGEVKWTDWGVRRILEPLGKQRVQIAYRPVNMVKNGTFLHYTGFTPYFWNLIGSWVDANIDAVVDGGMKLNGSIEIQADARPNPKNARYVESDVFEIYPKSDFVFSAQVTGNDVNYTFVEIKAFATGLENGTGTFSPRYLDRQGRWKDEPFLWYVEFGSLENDTISLSADSFFDQESEYRLPLNFTNAKITILQGVSQGGNPPADAWTIWKNVRLTQVPYEVAVVQREQWEIRNANAEFSFEEAAIETTLFDSDYTGLKGRMFLNTGQTADGWVLPNSGGARSQLYEQVLRARMRLLSRFVRLYEGEVRTEGAVWLTPGQVVTMAEELDNTMKALVLHVGNFDIKRGIGSVVLMELGTDEPAVTVEKIWQLVDGTEVELLKFDTVPTNPDNTGGIDEIDIEYEDADVTQPSQLSILKLGSRKTDIVQIGKTDSLVQIIGQAQITAGEVFLVAEGNTEPGLIYTDLAGAEVGYVKQVTGGTAIKAIDSTNHVVIDTSALTQDVILNVPNLAVNSTIATNITAWMLGGNGLINGDKKIGFGGVSQNYDGNGNPTTVDTFIGKLHVELFGSNVATFTPEGNFGVGIDSPTAKGHFHENIQGNAEVVIFKASNATQSNFFSVAVDPTANQVNFYNSGVLKIKNAWDFDALANFTISPTTINATTNAQVPNWGQVQSAIATGGVRGIDVDVATTGNVTLSGLQNIDGVTGVSDLVVLVRANSAGSGNGIYLMKVGAWVRHVDNDTSAEILGKRHYVKSGTTYGKFTFQNANKGTITVGTTAIIYSIDSANIATQLNTISINELLDVDINGVQNKHTLIWNNISGRFEDGLINWVDITNKPTTIAGYGITDFNSLWDARLGVKTTADLAEGVNKYYTDARARAAISSAISGLTYNPATGVLSQDSGYFMLYSDASNEDKIITLNYTSDLGYTVESKNTAYNKNFGAASNTVAQGNDSRILNGQIAFEWGNHALAGYVTNATFETAWNTFIGAIDTLDIGNVDFYANNIEASGTLAISGSLLDLNGNAGLVNQFLAATGAGTELVEWRYINISSVTGLQTTLDGKAATVHTHVAANITDFNSAWQAQLGTKVTSYAVNMIPRISNTAAGGQPVDYKLQPSGMTYDTAWGFPKINIPFANITSGNITSSLQLDGMLHSTANNTTNQTVGDVLVSRGNGTGSAFAPIWRKLTTADITNFAATVRTSISETVTGLDYNSATGILSLTSGYIIPTVVALDAKAEAVDVYTKVESDGMYVDLSNDQQINGVKKFNGQVQLEDTLFLSNKVTVADITLRYYQIGGGFHDSWRIYNHRYLDTDKFLWFVNETTGNGVLKLYGDGKALIEKLVTGSDVTYGDESANINGSIKYEGTLKPLGIPPSIGQFLKANSTSTNIWANITISDVTGLQTALDTKITFDSFQFTETDGIGGVRDSYGLKLLDLEGNEAGRVSYDQTNGWIGFETKHFDISDNLFTALTVVGSDGYLYRSVGSTAQRYALLSDIVPSGGGATPGLQAVLDVQDEANRRIGYRDGTNALRIYALRDDNARLSYRLNDGAAVNYALVSELNQRVLTWNNTDGASIKFDGGTGTDSYLEIGHTIGMGFNGDTAFGFQRPDSVEFASNMVIGRLNYLVTKDSSLVTYALYTKIISETKTGINAPTVEIGDVGGWGTTDLVEISGTVVKINGITLDMSGFAIGKVLKATSANTAAWETP